MLVAKGVTLAELILRSVVIARSLGIELYAAYAIIVAFVGVVQESCNLNCEVAFIKFGAPFRKDQESEKLNALITLSYLATGIAYLLSVFLIALLLAVGYELFIQVDGLYLQTVYFALASGLSFFGSLARAHLMLYDRFKVNACVEVAARMLGLLLIYATAWLFARNLAATLTAVIAAMIVTELAVLGVAAWELGVDLRWLNSFARCWGALGAGLLTAPKGTTVGLPASLGDLRSGGVRGQETRAQHGLDRRWLAVGTMGALAGRRREIARFVIGNSISTTLGRVMRKADVLIIASVGTPAAVAIYDVAKKFSALVVAIKDPLAMAVFPQVAQMIAAKQYGEFVKMLKSIYAILALPAIVTVGLFLFWGDQIAEGMFGDEFRNAGQTVFTLVLGSVLLVLSFWCNSFIVSLGRMRLQVTGYLLGAITSVVLGFTVAPVYGAIGMAFATTMGVVITQGIFTVTACQVIRSVIPPAA
jgi:O-antigen/teichoic acid export membrane protein